MEILSAMFALGLSLGVIGAGGAGIVIAVLVLFRIPIHTALGTSLAAMVFTTFSGTYSHFREGNVMIRSGMAVGVFGAIGAFAGARFSSFLPADELKWLTSGLLFISAILVYFRIFYPNMKIFSYLSEQAVLTEGVDFWLKACKLGIVTGFLSGAFGIGSTPFIQLGLLIFFNMPLYQTVGTTMFIIMPIALLGGLGYLISGLLDIKLFAEVALGLTAGAYIGAKFTKRISPLILKTTMVLVPAIGGILLVINSKI